MKEIAKAVVIMALFSLVACTEHHTQGSVTGGTAGSVSGAFLDQKNPWRGGVVGAGPGAAVGATLADISYRGSREAYVSGRPVEYRTEDGRGVYRADPLAYDARTRCRGIQEKVWEDKRLVKDQKREVCESRYERSY